MGFKDLVAKNSHEKILKQLEDLTSLVQSLDNNKFGPDKKPSLLRTIIFSDSIILITNKDTIHDGMHMMAASSLIMNKCFETGIPIKGALSHGKFTADFTRSLFFGQPLIDAFLLQEELHLYSIVINHDFENKLRSANMGGVTLDNNLRWFKYKTPFKRGKSTHYHLNWIFYFVEFFDDEEEEEEGFYSLTKKRLEKFYSTLSGSTRQYVDNTEDFISALIEYDKL